MPKSSPPIDPIHICKACGRKVKRYKKVKPAIKYVCGWEEY